MCVGAQAGWSSSAVVTSTASHRSSIWGRQGTPMDERDWLAERFEEHRTHLRAVAYRMLGSLAEADEAVQDAWLRVSRAGADGIENFRGWLTTIVARVCLNALQARKARPEDSSGVHLPDPVIRRAGEINQEHDVLLADSVGLALQIVLDTLSPAERMAFVLHDMFDVPFDEIGRMVGRSATAARQLASRGRRRVHGASVPAPDPDVARQREVVDAFFAAARRGDFDALVAVLDPNVVLRSDGGEKRRALSFVRRGASEVARTALASAQPLAVLHPALVNGAAGVVAVINGRPFAVTGFTVARGKIVAIDCLLDPERLARLDLAVRDDAS
jgi:RNA polymerase sigma factor (sigma-70 family)